MSTIFRKVQIFDIGDGKLKGGSVYLQLNSCFCGNKNHNKMSKEEKINRIFKAIADPTRREIFHFLIVASSALTLTQISEQFDMSRQGVTKHVKLLEEAGLIDTAGQGRERFCSANLQPLKEVKNWLAFYDKFWNIQLDKLDSFLGSKK